MEKLQKTEKKIRDAIIDALSKVVSEEKIDVPAAIEILICATLKVIIYISEYSERNTIRDLYDIRHFFTEVINEYKSTHNYGRTTKKNA